MKPILFNTEMVRAILDGRKTVTRRVVKLPSYVKRQPNGLFTLFAEGTCYENQHIENMTDYLKPPYQVNDILYVRETWNHYIYDNLSTGLHKEGYFYKASPEMKNTLPNYVQYHWGDKWKPSIHMPKEAARIFLNVKDVRIERLQSMKLDDILNEGISILPEAFNDPDNAYWQARDAFSALWNNTLGRKGTPEYYSNCWKGNPYVWVIEFEKLECNSMEEALKQIGE